jgi:hypothetical protein
VGRGEEESWRGREQVWILRLGFVWSWNYEYTCCGVDSGLIVGSGVVNGGTLRHSTYDYQRQVTSFNRRQSTIPHSAATYSRTESARDFFLFISDFCRSS